MDAILIVRCLCLFIAIWFGSTLVIKAMRGHPIAAWHFAVAAASVTGLVAIKFWL